MAHVVPEPQIRAMTLQTLGLGGGCHWCTEAVFQALTSVSEVEQGFIASEPPDDAFSEAVRLRFDPKRLPIEALIEVHLRTHASTSMHKMRGKYRSAVYVVDEVQAAEARAAIVALQRQFEHPLVTRVLPLVSFRASEARFRDYYRRGPERPFCRTYIEPKLTELRRRFRPLAQP